MTGPKMLRIPNSPLHRSGRLLCNNFSRSETGVSRLFLDPQYFHSSSTDGHSFPNPTSMAPALAHDVDFLETHPLESVALGYYPPVCASHVPRSVERYPTASSRPVANIHHSPTPTSQPFYVPADFDGMFLDPQAVPQPPAPPPAPETPLLPNPGFYYHLCGWLGGPQCDGFAPGKNREMAEHLRVCHHFVGHERDVVLCEWQACGQLMQRMNVARHIVSRHLLAAANCRFCGRRFSRPDVVTRHERTCTVVPSASTSSAYRA